MERAKRAIVTLGDIDLEVFQMPNGEYAFSINYLKSNLLIQANDKTGKKYVKPLLEENSKRLTSCYVEGAKPKAKLIPLDLVAQLIQIYAQLGNQKCIAIAIASVAESLERRADKVFNFIRTEEERNARFVARTDGILSRNWWTNVLQEYCETHDVSENYSKFLYSNVSDKVNRAFFGKSAKQLREEQNLTASVSLRDQLSKETLRQIQHVENMAAQKVQNYGADPYTAINEALDFWAIQPRAFA